MKTRAQAVRPEEFLAWLFASFMRLGKVLNLTKAVFSLEQLQINKGHLTG
jgi:hypothetical protein